MVEEHSVRWRFGLGFRRVGTRQCHRCGATTRLRPPQVGDTVQGPQGTAAQSQQTAPSSTPVTTPSAPATPVVQDVALPTDFTTRVRQLQPNTLVHIPVACRARVATLTTECWEGSAADKPGWSLLEEGRSKLLLSNIADGAHVPKELAIRSGLFE